MIVVNLDSIVHSFGTHLVLNGIGWEIKAGERIGLVGPNGAGKSTLLRIIEGQINPDSGRVYRHVIGHVFPASTKVRRKGQAGTGG